MSDADQRPQCGSEPGSGEEYDLAIHVVALFLVVIASISGAGFPVVAKKFPKLKIPPKAFFFCKHFGTGVLIATAFVHLLPTAFASLNDPCLPPLFTDDYPALPGVIMMGSLFCLFVLEMWLNSKMGGHSHGGPTGAEFSGGQAHGHAHAHGPVKTVAPHARPMREPMGPISRSDSEESFEKSYTWNEAKQAYAREREEELTMPSMGNQNASEMPAWFIAFYSQYIRQRDEMLNLIDRNMASVLPGYDNKQATAQDKEVSFFDADDHDIEEGGQGAVDPMVLKRMSLNITILEGGILFHSVFVGITVSATVDGFIVLLIAIMFHQTFEGLGLGSRIAAVPYPKGSYKPWLLVVAFGTTAPFGQAIGLLARNSFDINSAFGLIMVGMFNAISSGLLIYAALVDLLAEDFLSEEAQALMSKKDKTWAFIFVLMGAAGMSIVGAFA
ncbi:Fe(2+) transport protein 3 [Lasiodiplodia theobromae]|uniref:Zinc-regulated transporter 2 n=1 Tax=Lasiodiplodia theobromae TaxID=45133 RepID=A0A5N5D1F5_9PEZI|nr:Fe(2+) transport protein 3 [Lasiodiplodia theobromae]KAB2571252.1 Zinc-regulated transporter 2 [Lasiodiplodia theobromae]KAF4542773.1 Fe(2+) transport protein 3 [Lasiodiplodia theobromae]